MIDSVTSYGTFKTRAWALLNNNKYVNANMSTLANDLYNDCYSQPKVNALAADKVALTGRPLALKMREICQEYDVNRTVWNQSLGRNIDVVALRDEYRDRAAYLNIGLFTRIFCCCCYCGYGDLSDDAISSSTAYLHAFPDPANLMTGADVNWRLVANIEPTSMEAAVRAACDIMDANADIYEFKISAPGYVGKPDSLILYLKNRNATYNNIRQAFTLAVANLNIQGTSAPMVNELAAGVAECSEPPWVTYDVNQTHQFSFGTYRCFLAAMAFKSALATAGNLGALNAVAFEQEVDDTFNAYGVPDNNPHRQNAVNYANNTQQYAAFMNALDDYYNVLAGTMSGRNAAFGNPPAIV